MEDNRLSMGLDDIISKKSNGGARRNTGPIRNNSGSRGRRISSSAPYDSDSKPRKPTPVGITASQVRIKLLISNAVAGLVIGKGGKYYEINKFSCRKRDFAMNGFQVLTSAHSTK